MLAWNKKPAENITQIVLESKIAKLYEDILSHHTYKYYKSTYIYLPADAIYTGHRYISYVYYADFVCGEI